MDPSLSGYLEIGSQAVWSLSSCKSGYGVSNLRDNSLETYWQSDGAQPHQINIEFMKKTDIGSVSIYTDFGQDESYTPSKIAVKAGTHHHDLIQVQLIELQEPSGWINVYASEESKPIRVFLLQLCIIANHQNGRDTHIRQIKVFEPKPVNILKSTINEFFTPEFKAYQTLR